MGPESLRRFACWFLFCWWIVAQTATTNDVNALRQQKMQELLRILGNYTRTSHPKSTSSTELTPTSLMDDQSTSTPSTLGRTSKSNAPDFPESFPDENSYREFYRVFYGTEEGINHLKKHYGPNGLKRARARYANVNRGLEDLRRANEHVLRIRTRARCSTPTPVLVRVKDYYPDPSREYFPRCTLLHKCGEASGCCENDAYKCVPKAVQEVALHFYTIAVGEHGLGNHIGPSTARLLFDNHTACQCQPINDWPRISSDHDPRPSPLDGKAPPGEPSSNLQTKCRECPMPFTSRIYSDGSCGCDCFYRQRPCLKIKRGRRPLPEVERSCIEANFCRIPDCEYGSFNKTTGYCPKRHNRLRRSLSHITKHKSWGFVRTK